MVERARKSRPSAAPSSQRAKSLPPRPVDDRTRALEKFAEAAAAFDAVCEDHGGLGQLDERYAAMLRAAAHAVVALGGAAHPELPEEDVRLADAALRELRGCR